jgi:hypothetical protein
MRTISTNSDLLIGILPMKLSAHIRCLPEISANAADFRAVPLWDVFTPGAALIFINNFTEKFGVL